MTMRLPTGGRLRQLVAAVVHELVEAEAAGDWHRAEGAAVVLLDEVRARAAVGAPPDLEAGRRERLMRAERGAP